jgi:outer membrane protein TolC
MASWRMFVLPLMASPLAAQDTTLLAKPAYTASLTMSEALGQARQSNVGLRQAQIQTTPAGVAVRSAYGDFIPRFTAQGGVVYAGDGQTIVAGRPVGNPANWSSNYSLDLNLSISGATFFNTGQAKANRDAASADVESARIGMLADVATQYLNGLQAEANAEVARQQLKRNYDFLSLSRARNRVGQASLFDVRQAEVTYNNSEVDLLRTLQQEQEAKLELYRRIGTQPPTDVKLIALTDTFPTRDPSFDVPALIREAEENNPQLVALRARENAAGASVKAAKSQFFPTLNFFAQKAGQTLEFVGDPVVGVPPSGDFPFGFEGQPVVAGVGISLPIFTGFQRDLDVSRAHAQQRDFREQVRQQELDIGAQVQGRTIAVETAWLAIAVQDRSRSAARDQLKLAEERYRLGSGTALEVSDALNAVTAADAAYVNAVYDYHRAVVALTATVGRDYVNNPGN